MKEYERLTERDTDGIAIYKQKCNADDMFENLCIQAQREEAVLNRLAEFEDKIENGTLIELPCKVGATVFRLEKDCSKCPFYKEDRWESDFWCTFDNENTKNMFEVDGDKDCVHTIEEVKFQPVLKLGENVFLTKAEAEKKLKELKGE